MSEKIKIRIIKKTKNPFISALAVGFVIAGVFCFMVFTSAYYNPGEIINPTCSPTDPECDVVASAVYSFGTNNFSGTGNFSGGEITGTKLLHDANTYIDKDGSNNMTFTDTVTGTKTLAELVGGGGYTNLTSFVEQTAWRSFYSDGSGYVKELAFGDAGKALISGGATSAPTWGTDFGANNVVTTGTLGAGVGTFDYIIETTPTLQLLSEKNVANGYVGLDADGNLIVSAIIPQYDTEANLAEIVLEEGALATSLDTHKLFQGDGVTAGGIDIAAAVLLQNRVIIGDVGYATADFGWYDDGTDYGTYNGRFSAFTQGFESTADSNLYFNLSKNYDSFYPIYYDGGDVSMRWGITQQGVFSGISQNAYNLTSLGSAYQWTVTNTNGSFVSGTDGTSVYNILTAGTIGAGAITGTSFVATAAGGLTLGTDVVAPTVNIPGYIKMFSAGNNAYYSTFTSGIQTANATYTLPTAMAASSGYILSSTTAGILSWVADGASDERFKENVTPLGDDILDKLTNIQGVYYNWNDLYRSINPSAGTNTQIGMIAQNVEQQFPELITKDKDGYKNLNYKQFTAVLLEGIKELNQKIDSVTGAVGSGQVAGIDDNSLTEKIKNTFASVKEIIVDKLTVKVAKIEKLEMVDSATGEIYCTWIENGEWKKVKGECDSMSTPVDAPVPQEEPLPAIEPVVEPMIEEPKLEPVPEIQPEVTPSPEDTQKQEEPLPAIEPVIEEPKLEPVPEIQPEVTPPPEDTQKVED